MTAEGDPGLGRRERRRRTTRAALVAAARHLVVEKGPDALTVADVTQAADVGFGTFYGYFDTKEALLEAVVDEVLDDLGRTNDALTAGLDDPALIVAVAIRHMVRTAIEQPQLAALLVRFGFSGDSRLWEGLHQRMLRDLEAGVSAGRFRGDRLAAATVTVGGAVMAALRANDLGWPQASLGDLDRGLAETLLGGLGLAVEDAASVTTEAGVVLAAAIGTHR